MNRAERRQRTKRIIKKRKDKLKYIAYYSEKAQELEDGYLKNNNEMNKYGSGGTAIKTNTRKGHASYRHNGAYGSANNYSAHDQRQIDRGKYDEDSN